MELVKEIKQLEQVNGRKFTKDEKTFAVHLATSGNQADAARQIGSTGDHARKYGSKMASKPEIQALVETVQNFQTDIISEDFIKSAMLKEALEAKAPRDRLNALQLLAKTKGMLKDVQETTVVDREAEQIAKDIGKQFGEEAERLAREDLGLAAA